MRHGNAVKTHNTLVETSLRSYLWGMETHQRPEQQDQQSNLTPILPMRHGNLLQRSWRITISLTPILPMRHGNSIFQQVLMCGSDTPILPMRHGNISTWGIGSNSEMKTPILPMRHGNLIDTHLLPGHILYSDPTYEAWKPDNLERAICWGNDSDPTYEAWKPRLSERTSKVENQLRSYLWGMETPLREKDHSIWNPLRSYLWGMETFWPPFLWILIWTALRSYLWGMETIFV